MKKEKLPKEKKELTPEEKVKKNRLYKLAYLGIVGGIDDPLAFAVECYISGVVKLDAVDILQPPLLARF